MDVILDHVLDEELPGPVAAPDKGARCDVSEPRAFSHGPIAFELLRLDVFDYAKVPCGGSKVLADGEEIHSYLPKVQHRLTDLLLGFPEADHYRGLRVEALVELLDVPEH